ncbi:oligosaccharide flippase family protein [Vibrio sp. RC27]
MINNRILQLIWVFTERFGLIVLATISFYVFALELTPEQLGKGVLALSIIEFAGLFFTAALEDPFVRQTKLDSEKDGTLFWSSLIISLVCSILIISGIAIVSDDSAFIYLVAFATLKLPVLLCSRVFVAHLRRAGKFKALMIRTIYGKVLGSICAIYLAMTGAGAWAIVVQAVVMDVVAFVILLSVDRRPLPLKINFKFLHELLSVGVVTSLKAISMDMMGRGINLMVGVVAGNEVLGIFNMAQRLIELLRSSIYTGLASYALPVMSRRQNDIARLSKFFMSATKYTHLMILPLFLGLAVVADDVVVLIFGMKWQPSVVVLQSLAVITAVGSILVLVPSLLLAVKKPQLTLKSEVLGSLIAVASIFIFGPLYGALAGAIAVIVRFILILQPNCRALNQVANIGSRDFFKQLIPIYLSGFLMVSTVLVLNNYFQYDALMLPVKIVVGMLSYVVALFIFDRFWLKDMMRFIKND